MSLFRSDLDGCYDARRLIKAAIDAHEWEPLHLTPIRVSQMAYALHYGLLKLLGAKPYGVWVMRHDIKDDLSQITKCGHLGYVDTNEKRSYDRLFLLDAESYTQVDIKPGEIKKEDVRTQQEETLQMKKELAIIRSARKEVNELAQKERDRRTRVQIAERQQRFKEKDHGEHDNRGGGPSQPKESDRVFEVVCSKGIAGVEESVLTTANLGSFDNSPVLGKLVWGALLSPNGHVAIRLSNCDGFTFYMFAHWMRHGKIPAKDMTDSQGKSTSSTRADDLPDYERLIDLWVLGKFLRCMGILKAVLLAVHKKSATVLPKVAELQHLAKATKTGDSLRAVLRDLTILRMKPADAIELRWKDPTNPFYEAVALGMRQKIVDGDYTLPPVENYLKNAVGGFFAS